MKSSFYFLLALVLISCQSTTKKSSEQTAETEDSTYVQPPLLMDLFKWEEIGGAVWVYEGDEISVAQASSTGYRITEDTYKDFHLKIDFFPDAIVNSGIFIRCLKNDSINADNCYEINIWDEHVNQDFRTGAIVGKQVPIAKVETVGKWNTYEIKAKGKHIQAWVNGVQTADYHEAEHRAGTIALQIFGDGMIRFRNLSIEPL